MSEHSYRFKSKDVGTSVLLLATLLRAIARMPGFDAKELAVEFRTALASAPQDAGFADYRAGLETLLANLGLPPER